MDYAGGKVELYIIYGIVKKKAILGKNKIACIITSK